MTSRGNSPATGRRQGPRARRSRTGLCSTWPDGKAARMQADIARLVAEIDSLASVNEVQDLFRLEELMRQFFAHPAAAEHLAVWFRLFERFPEDDAFELFWSILHGVEALPGYEPFVVESIRKRPSRFPL